MLDKLKIKLKEIKANKDSKKFMTNLIIFLFIGIILILTNNGLTTKSKNSEKPGSKDILYEASEDINTDLIQDNSNSIENELEEILSHIKGVGDVKVMVNLEDTSEKIPAFNINTLSENTNEKDSGGGVREVIREDLKREIVTDNDKSLMIIKEVRPNVRGVIVVAEGAEDILIKEQLYSAVKTVLGIQGNKVEVYSSK